MPHEPKKRHSRARQGKRRAAISMETVTVILCKNCGTPVAPHTVCSACGYYKGAKVI